VDENRSRINGVIETPIYSGSTPGSTLNTPSPILPAKKKSANLCFDASPQAIVFSVSNRLSIPNFQNPSINKTIIRSFFSGKCD
jgi:hypothetical protein